MTNAQLISLATPRAAVGAHGGTTAGGPTP
jgi:hypothetical protein